MAENVTFGIKINVDDKGVGQATVNVKELANVVDKVREAANKNPFKEWKTSIVEFEALTSALERISGAIGELTDYYKQQEVAEAKLAQVMQNTMGATEADTQAILDLCSAQQKLGVIGDEVQIAGAQELATYLTQRDTLESLIPVMNDMVAQQYGLGATQENAAQIATMLGKVMDGQVNALSRYGYKFDEAQETILRFGTEEERAAVLAEVVGASVGGVNQALAQTSSGKMQQLANAVGDVKEQLGKVLVNVGPVINGLIGMGQTVISIKEIAPVIMNIGSAIGGLIGKLATATAAWFKHTAAVVANKAQLIAHTVAQGTVKAATVAWTAVQKVLNIVLTANPIGLIVTAIGALVAAIIYAWNNCETFRNICLAVWNVIKQGALIIKDALVAAFRKLATVLEPVWNWIKKVAGIIWNNLVQSFNICKDAIVEFWNNADGLRAVLNKVWSVIKQGAQIIWDNLVKAFDAVTGAIKKAWNWIKNFLGIGNKDTEEQAAALNDEADAANKTADAYKNLDKYRQMAANQKGGSTKTSSTKNTKSGGKKTGLLERIDAEIMEKQALYKAALDEDSAAKVKTELENLEAKKRLIEFEIQLKQNGIDSIKDALPQMKMEPIDITVTGLPTLKATNIELVKTDKNEQKLDTTQKKVARDGKKLNEVMDATGQLTGNTSEAIRALTKDDNNAAAAWIDYGAAVAQSCAKMVTSILSLIPAKKADEMQSNANTTANTAEAASGFFSSFAEIPIVGIILALAAVAGMVATMMSLPKFAKGGIAYGPTMGLFGEYPGAANNPEVVAPLNRLKSLLGGTGDSEGRVRFEIKGRRLVGVLNRENTLSARR